MIEIEVKAEAPLIEHGHEGADGVVGVGIQFAEVDLRVKDRFRLDHQCPGGFEPALRRDYIGAGLQGEAEGLLQG
jgi:hypothetical protein